MQTIPLLMPLSTTDVVEALSLAKPASARNRVCPLQLNYAYIIKESRSADVQLLIRPGVI